MEQLGLFYLRVNRSGPHTASRLCQARLVSGSGKHQAAGTRYNMFNDERRAVEISSPRHQAWLYQHTVQLAPDHILSELGHVLHVGHKPDVEEVPGAGQLYRHCRHLGHYLLLATLSMWCL